MRKALYTYMTTNCKSIKTWLQPYQPTASTPKPYGVLVIGEKRRDAFNRRGAYRDLHIWPYLLPSSFVALDEAVNEIEQLLAGKTLEGTIAAESDEGADVKFKFLVEWVGEQKDFYDSGLNAITRRIDFRIPLIRSGY